EGGDDEENDALGKRSQEAQARLDEVNEKLGAYVAFDPEQMKSAGCFVSVRGDGEVHVERGLVKPEDKRKVAKAAAVGSDEGKAEPPARKEYSQSLIRDLGLFRLQVA